MNRQRRVYGNLKKTLPMDGTVRYTLPDIFLELSREMKHKWMNLALDSWKKVKTKFFGKNKTYGIDLLGCWEDLLIKCMLIKNLCTTVMLFLIKFKITKGSEGSVLLRGKKWKLFSEQLRDTAGISENQLTFVQYLYTLLVFLL